MPQTPREHVTPESAGTREEIEGVFNETERVPKSPEHGPESDFKRAAELMNYAKVLFEKSQTIAMKDEDYETAAALAFKAKCVGIKAYGELAEYNPKVLGKEGIPRGTDPRGIELSNEVNKLLESVKDFESRIEPFIQERTY